MKKYKIRDIYKASGLSCSYTTFSTINKMYLKFIIELMLEGHKVYLPYRMGSIQVIGKKPKYKIEDGTIKGLAPDWKATREYRLTHPDSTKVLFHTNPDTDNYRYKIRWSKFNIFAKFKKDYTVRFTRNIKRTLSANILKDHVKYKTE